jgi:trk system potassium uptake protein TrkH
MSFRKLGKILGKIMILEGLLMFFPLLVAVIYQENFINVLAFAIPIIALIVLGIILILSLFSAIKY